MSVSVALPCFGCMHLMLCAAVCLPSLHAVAAPTTHHRHTRDHNAHTHNTTQHNTTQHNDSSKRPKSDWETGVEATPAAPGGRWDATPAAGSSGAGWDAPPAAGGARRNRWDETPAAGVGATPAWGGTGAEGKKRSRWDETPAAAPGAAGAAFGATPLVGAGGAVGGAFGATPAFTPGGAMGLETPLVGAGGAGAVPMTPEQYAQYKVDREMEQRNRPLSDEELDALLPGPEDGYKVLAAPPGYQPIYTPARKLMATPTPGMLGGGATPLYAIPAEEPGSRQAVPPQLEGLPDMKPEDMAFFGKLLQDAEDAELSVEEAKERKIMKLLLKVKNGAPPQRKSALRQLTDKAVDFGPKALFDQILPLLMQPTLEDQERHLLVKVVDRVLFKLEDRVRPYVHKILVVIEPLLIGEEQEGGAFCVVVCVSVVRAALLLCMCVVLCVLQARILAG